MGTEALVGLPLDGGGKKVKNFLLQGVRQADGTSADVYVQCAAIVDQDGRAVDFDAHLETLKCINRKLGILIGMVGEIGDVGPLVDDADEENDNSRDG